MNIKIAIDGPSGSGKSTLAKNIAKALGLVYVDTGALYRTIGLYAKRCGVALEEASKVVGFLPDADLALKYTEEGQRVLLNGEDVSDLIRTPEMSMYASAVSAVPAVRAFLLEIQRKMTTEGNVVMDGRDIGTVVLPDAELKLFLTAKPEIRAQRRVLQLAEKGIEANYDDVLADVIQRDYNDSHRDFRPLKLAEDGILIDNTELPLDETVEKIISLAKERMA